MRLAHSVVLAFGWRRAAIACGAGAVSTLALAPFNAWPVLFLTFPLLVWLLDGSAAGRGLSFLAVFSSASAAERARDPAETRGAGRGPVIGLAILAGLAALGAVRLAGAPTAFVSGVRLRIMQPNLQQDEKFNFGAKQ